jgi:AraC-like DNA-binding protein
MGVPCYSARFIQPFAQALATYEAFDAKSLARLKAISPEGRIPMTVANDLAIEQVAQTGDADLGLKAAGFSPLGVGGVLDYAMNTAPTMRDAFAVGGKFARLFSDALRIEVEVTDRRAHVRLRSSIAAPRTIADYAMAVWWAHNLRGAAGADARVECSMLHPRPPDTLEYERTFERATLRFNAEEYAFSFNRERLEAPRPMSDPALHVVLCAHAALLLDHLPDRFSLVERVRDLALRELLRGNPTVGNAAKTLRMSTRTLASRLQSEGTTFSSLVDQMRRELALGYLDDHRLTPTEIAFRIGFSHVEAFYRAFKRWTGQTPAAYRKARESNGPAIAPPSRHGEAPRDEVALTHVR